MTESGRGAGENAHATPHRRLTLRAKGWVAFVALLVFEFGAYAYVQQERDATLRAVATLERLHLTEDALTRASLALSDVVFYLYRTSPLASTEFKRVARDLRATTDLLASAFGPAAEEYPLLQRKVRLLVAAAVRFDAETSRAGLLEVREALGSVTRDLDREVSAARERRKAVNTDIRRNYERISSIAIATSFAGLLAFGIVIYLFFRRMTLDLDALRRRAQQIVAGERGNPMNLDRRDELGDLGRAVDRMADDLADREQRMALALRQDSHQERMAALGNMAANVAHEIGNPVATVSALVQDIAGRSGGDRETAAQARLILEQCERIGHMTRQIADMATPHPMAPAPVELNGLAKMVCNFLRFDPRLQRARIALALADDVPLALAVADHLVQILMDVLVAAVEHVPTEALTGALEVRTGVDERGLFVRIAPGVADEFGSAAFRDEAKITLARHLARSMRGEVELVRVPAPVVTIWVPAGAPEGRS